jgi:hypothetical protein
MAYELALAEGYDPASVILSTMTEDERGQLAGFAVAIHEKLPEIAAPRSRVFVPMAKATDKQLRFLACIYRKEGYNVNISYTNVDRYLSFNIEND